MSHVELIFLLAGLFGTLCAVATAVIAVRAVHKSRGPKHESGVFELRLPDGRIQRTIVTGRDMNDVVNTFNRVSAAHSSVPGSDARLSQHRVAAGGDHSAAHRQPQSSSSP